MGYMVGHGASLNEIGMVGSIGLSGNHIFQKKKKPR